MPQVPPQEPVQPSLQTAPPPATSTVEPQVTSSAGSSGGAVSWTASEYIHHHKGINWYLGLGLAAVAGAVLVYVVTQDRITFATILIVSLLLGVFASRQPRVLRYELNDSGITIGQQHYPYDDFRSFAIQEEGGLQSIFLVPLKRVMPGLSIYYPPEQANEVINTLSLFLPHEERKPDPIDRITRLIRF